MPNNADDFPLLQQPVPLVQDGTQAVVRYWQDASPEIRNLISNECSVIFECRECRNLFRSIVNFISHKRVICRSLLEISRPSSSDVQQVNEKATSELNCSSADPQAVLLDSTEQPMKKKAYLRRTNIVNAISKRAEHYSKKLAASKGFLTVTLFKDTVFLQRLPSVWRPVPTTTFQHGQQVFVTVPKNMAEKEPLLSDKVTLIVPQDHSIKYREMNLRRRDNDPKVAPARYAFFDEVELADAGLLTCMHSDCVEKQPFSSLYTLAYHITVRHNRRFFPEKKNFCFVCGRFFESYDITVAHLKKQHSKYYEEHRSFRMAPNDEKVDCRKARKRKASEKVLPNEHSGSLSPLSDYSEESDSPPSLCRFEYEFKNCNALDALG
ncbi:unnamed protein product [Enterobius vermicularis]|uniref:C2H2-type domain-containing protein n=1 Tax=Enterobius vermicularis TaxID=51028 RepID=A0A0N4UWZ4_ENTVE|nr:unnamed protein product [Enterobius vermicularis]